MLKKMSPLELLKETYTNREMFIQVPYSSNGSFVTVKVDKTWVRKRFITMFTDSIEINVCVNNETNQLVIGEGNE